MPETVQIATEKDTMFLPEGKVSDLENIKNRLDELCGQLNGNTTTITFPGCNLPENKPETTPPSEDTNTPESKPETTPPSEDANTPENKPEADKRTDIC